MTFPKTLVLGAVATVWLVSLGCSQDPGAENSVSATTPSQLGQDPKDPSAMGPNALEGANAQAGRGGATIRHAPPTDGKIPPGGLVLTPADPNDPKFKPAPGMAGGG